MKGHLGQHLHESNPSAWHRWLRNVNMALGFRNTWSTFETSQFLQIIFAVLLLELLLNVLRNWISITVFLVRKRNVAQWMMMMMMDDFLTIYSDLTIIKITAADHLEFLKFAFYVTWPLSLCCSTSPRKILLKSNNLLPNYCEKISPVRALTVDF